MMNYEIFKEVVKDSFKDYLPEQYKDMELRVCSVNKVNRMMDGINLIGESEVKNVSPTIYINDMYDHYKACNDLKKAIQAGADCMVNAFKMCPEAPRIDFAEAKDNIVFQLINTKQNKEMLAGIPHRDFQDLSIIYRWVIKMDDDGIQSTLIKNSLAEQLGVNEEQLFKMAAENTKRIFPPRIRSMNEVICEMFMKDGMPQEIAEMMIGEMPADKSMWVISNDRGVNGAVSMLYEDKLHTLAIEMESEGLKEKGENVYIDSLTYEEFGVLTELDMRKRFLSLDEKEQREKLNKEQDNELQYAPEEEDTKETGEEAKPSGSGGAGTSKRKIAGEDTWSYVKI